MFLAILWIIEEIHAFKRKAEIMTQDALDILLHLFLSDLGKFFFHIRFEDRLMVILVLKENQSQGIQFRDIIRHIQTSLFISHYIRKTTILKRKRPKKPDKADHRPWRGIN